MSRCEHDRPSSELPHHLQFFVTPQTWLAQLHSSVVVAWVSCHACVCCATIDKESVCHGLLQQRALFIASQHRGSPEMYVARRSFSHHYDGRAASWHQADNSSQDAAQFFCIHSDLLTTVVMLTCCTRSFAVCLRLLTRRWLWRFFFFFQVLQLLLVARGRHDVTFVQEIQLPALSGCLLTICVWLRMIATTEVPVSVRASVT